ncbi:hypothetical protein J6590_022610 [Homalodisca vitripennis]|nr:hypothetical protein J6590_022610 [Homalodisca vitripennis]
MTSSVPVNTRRRRIISASNKWYLWARLEAIYGEWFAPRPPNPVNSRRAFPGAQANEREHVGNGGISHRFPRLHHLHNSGDHRPRSHGFHRRVGAKYHGPHDHDRAGRASWADRCTAIALLLPISSVEHNIGAFYFRSIC